MTELPSISIESEILGPAELRRLLQGELREEGIALELQRHESPFRMEPVILVAVLAGGFQVLTALVTGLLALAKREETGAQKIRIEDGSGIVLELPANTPASKARELLEAARDLQIKKIVLLSPP